MNHFASSGFWALYNALPPEARKVAEKNHQLLVADFRHPSLHFKRIGNFWSVRAGIQHRALGVEVPDGILWIWIGTHREYEKIIGG